MKRPYDGFYDSEAWMRLRYQALKLRGGRCQCCGEQPTRHNPLHVDHIKPRSRFPHLALTLDNLQVLCKKCNLGKGAWDDTDWRPEINRERWEPKGQEGKEPDLPLREAMVLTAAFNHPWLLVDRAEELASFLFSNVHAVAVQRAVLDACAAGKDAKLTTSALLAAMDDRGLGDAARQIMEGARGASPVVQKGANPADVHQWWIFAIHSVAETRRLTVALREAEAALGKDMTNANYERLRSLVEQLQAIDRMFRE